MQPLNLTPTQRKAIIEVADLLRAGEATETKVKTEPPSFDLSLVRKQFVELAKTDRDKAGELLKKYNAATLADVPGDKLVDLAIDLGLSA